MAESRVADNGDVGSEEHEAAMRRAEQLVDQAASVIGVYARRLGDECQRLAARAREEAEDMWAEAQAIRDARRPQ